MFVIDRFEGDIAVLEDADGKMVDVARGLLPKGAKEGDCLVLDGARYVLDEAETKERAARIQRKMDALWD